MTTITIDHLSSYGVERSTNSTVGFRMDDLLDSDRCHQFLLSYMRKIQAPNVKVAASLFIKQYARGSIGSMLYSLGTSNSALTMPLHGCTFSDERKLCIQEGACPWRTCQSQNRNTWRYYVLHEFFSEHLTPLIGALSETPVSPRILWENTAVRILSVYRKLLQAAKSNDERQQLLGDFHFLKQADGSLFDLDKNPISAFLHEEALSGNTCQRTTCCLYNRLEHDPEGIGHCKVCPLTKKVKTYA